LIDVLVWGGALAPTRVRRSGKVRPVWRRCSALAISGHSGSVRCSIRLVSAGWGVRRGPWARPGAPLARRRGPWRWTRRRLP